MNHFSDGPRCTHGQSLAAAEDPSAELAVLEATIERGLGTFIEVGNALIRIKDERLYRESGYTDFDTYSRERWGWTARRSRQLMAAAEVGTIVPLSNEAQARELAKLPDHEIPEAWDEVQRNLGPGEKPTAAKVKDAVERRKGPHATSPGALARKAAKQGQSLVQTVDEILDVATTEHCDALVNAIGKVGGFMDSMMALENRFKALWDLGRPPPIVVESPREDSLR